MLVFLCILLAIVVVFGKAYDTVGAIIQLLTIVLLLIMIAVEKQYI